MRGRADERSDFDAGDIAIAPLVYLVGDRENSLGGMILGLSGLGLNVIGFDSAASFYRAYAARPSDIVVLDIGPGGEDGLSIVSHLRASQSVGIVLATGRDSVGDRINGLKAGADACLARPIDFRELAATVIALNERLNRGRSPARPSGPAWALVEGGWVLVDGMGHRLRLTTAEQRFLGRLFVERGVTVERRLQLPTTLRGDLESD